MRLVFHWFLPTSGDGRGIVGGGPSGWQAQQERSADDRPQNAPPGRRSQTVTRPPSLDYLTQIARSAEQLGFTGVLTPTGTWCEDAWLVTAALTRETSRLKFLVAFRPGLTSPTLAAQMAATYQRISRGRLLLNVVTGGDAVEQQRFGDWLEHDQRYARTDEFLAIVRKLWSGAPVDFDGQHLKIAGGLVPTPPDPLPQIYFGGSSEAALPVAARHVDVYLTWGEPPAQVAQKIARVRELAEAGGRTLRFGIRLHTISRDSSREAWAEADRLIEAIDPTTLARAQSQLGASQSVGQQRMVALHGGRLDKLEIYPNLWAGIGLVRGGAGTALVGSHQEVADRIEEYHSIGIEEFIFSGYPHLEEAYWFGEGVRPELVRRGLIDDTVSTSARRELVPAL